MKLVSCLNSGLSDESLKSTGYRTFELSVVPYQGINHTQARDLAK